MASYWSNMLHYFPVLQPIYFTQTSDADDSAIPVDMLNSSSTAASRSSSSSNHRHHYHLQYEDIAYHHHPHTVNGDRNAVYLDLYSNDMRAVAVADLMRQIRIAHGASSTSSSSSSSTFSSTSIIPDPIAAMFMDWSRYPFHGGWHAWKIGVKSSQVREKLRGTRCRRSRRRKTTTTATTTTTTRTFVCGEAYSDLQGWVEGALRSCEKLLIDQFHLPSKYADYLQCS